jgi:hypothetical protein
MQKVADLQGFLGDKSLGQKSGLISSRTSVIPCSELPEQSVQHPL